MPSCYSILSHCLAIFPLFYSHRNVLIINWQFRYCATNETPFTTSTDLVISSIGSFHPSSSKITPATCTFVVSNFELSKRFTKIVSLQIIFQACHWSIQPFLFVPSHNLFDLSPQIYVPFPGLLLVLGSHPCNVSLSFLVYQL